MFLTLSILVGQTTKPSTRQDRERKHGLSLPFEKGEDKNKT